MSVYVYMFKVSLSVFTCLFKSICVCMCDSVCLFPSTSKCLTEGDVVPVLRV